jgi:hypothetical protein
MLRDRGDERIRDSTRLQADSDELLAVENLVHGTQALDVGVDVDAPVAIEDLQAQDVGPLDGSPQRVEDLGTDRILRKVVLPPETVLPLGVVTPPGLDPAAMVVGQRIGPDPDLVDGPRYRQAT